MLKPQAVAHAVPTMKLGLSPSILPCHVASPWSRMLPLMMGSILGCSWADWAVWEE